MESTGLEGHMQISEDTYSQLPEGARGQFCERGEIAVKGKGAPAARCRHAFCLFACIVG